MAHFDQYLTKGQEIHRKYRQERDAIKGDKELKDEAKRNRLAALEQRRQQEVATLATDAHVILKGRRVTLQRTQRQEAEQRLEARRKLLGDVLLADLYRREIEALDPDEIVQKYQEVPTLWEKEVIAGYAMPMLSTKLRTGQDPAALSAWNELSQAAAQNEPEGYRKATAELADVDEAMQRIERGELDREAYNNEFAARMGLNPAHMPD